MYDLSLVTETLRQILVNALASSPVWGGVGPPFQVGVTAQNPDQSATTADTDLNLFLFHVAEDQYQKNAFWNPAGQLGPDQPVAYQPACFDLYYLVSARSQTGYVNEQQVMGVAMKALHDNAIVRMPTPVPFGGAPSEVTVTMERPSWDELCRLWQGIAAPMRMSAEYRVAAVFLSPEQPRAGQQQVTSFQVEGDASFSPLAQGTNLPQIELAGTSRTVTYATPAGTGSYEVTPASTAPASPAPPLNSPGCQVMFLRASGVKPTDTVYLVSIDSSGHETETDITATWEIALAPPYPSAPLGGVAIQLQPPSALGAPPDCPPPGSYLLRAGRPGAPGWRSNSVPVMIAPWVSPVGGPLLNPSGAGTYTATVNNVPATGADVRLGTVPLSQKSGGSLSPGQWSLTGTSTLKFKAPVGLPAGQYALRVRAANVEADPALWAVLP